MRYYRKIIRISADDSPNIRRARYLLRQHPEMPHDEVCRRSTVLPGPISWEEFCKRDKVWDEPRKCVGLHGQFFYGAESLLFPPNWLNHAADMARALPHNRKPTHMGVDPAEGGDMSTWALIDGRGLILLESVRTPDTTLIVKRTLAHMRDFGIQPENVAFDRGGGGQQHVDMMRDMGYNVRSIAFGETISLDPKRRTMTFFAEKVQQKETKYEYCNRRAQMFGELSEMLNPGGVSVSFAIPAVYDLALVEGRKSLRQQLAVMPKLWDKEGRLRMLPKNAPSKVYADVVGEEEQETLVGLIGHSPDEADALALAVHVLLHKRVQTKAGAVA